MRVEVEGVTWIVRFRSEPPPPAPAHAWDCPRFAVTVATDKEFRRPPEPPKGTKCTCGAKTIRASRSLHCEIFREGQRPDSWCDEMLASDLSLPYAVVRNFPPGQGVAFDGRILAVVGQAVCAATDNFCRERGRKLALGRCLKRLFPLRFQKPQRRSFWLTYHAQKTSAEPVLVHQP